MEQTSEMEAAPEGGVIVASAPRGAGHRGRLTDKATAHDWDAIAEWHRHPWHSGLIVRYGPIPSDLMRKLKETYPDLTFLGHNHHHQVGSTTAREFRKVCDVYVSRPVPEVPEAMAERIQEQIDSGVRHERPEATS